MTADEYQMRIVNQRQALNNVVDNVAAGTCMFIGGRHVFTEWVKQIGSPSDPQSQARALDFARSQVSDPRQNKNNAHEITRQKWKFWKS